LLVIELIGTYFPCLAPAAPQAKVETKKEVKKEEKKEEEPEPMAGGLGDIFGGDA
jgi:hypothetical protein